MDIKTDWTPDDYYNIHDDLTRTEGNIHEIAAVLSAAGRPASLDEKLYWTMQDFREHKRIANSRECPGSAGAAAVLQRGIRDRR